MSIVLDFSDSCFGNTTVKTPSTISAVILVESIRLGKLLKVCSVFTPKKLLSFSDTS